jgi:uncharacterized protein (TIGR02453 family)
MQLTQRKCVNMLQNEFNGFSDKTFEFLRNLDKNNNREWFEKHRDDYLNHLLNPMKALVEELCFTMLDIDSLIEVTPAVNKTVSRIYNDRRFAKNKPPYKCAMWLKLQRPRSDWKTLPGFFFEITPKKYQYGMGFYQATPVLMTAFRDSIDKDYQKFLDIILPIEKSNIYKLEGEDYKNNKMIHSNQKINNWYSKKSFYLGAVRGIDQVVKSDKLVDDLISGFNHLKPLYNYIWGVIKSQR